MRAGVHPMMMAGGARTKLPDCYYLNRRIRPGAGSASVYSGSLSSIEPFSADEWAFIVAGGYNTSSSNRGRVTKLTLNIGGQDITQLPVLEHAGVNTSTPLCFYIVNGSNIEPTVNFTIEYSRTFNSNWLALHKLTNIGLAAPYSSDIVFEESSISIDIPANGIALMGYNAWTANNPWSTASEMIKVSTSPGNYGTAKFVPGAQTLGYNGGWAASNPSTSTFAGISLMGVGDIDW